MHDVPGIRVILRRGLMALCVAGLLGGLAVASDAESEIPREGPRPPHPTDKGRFEGTWTRIEPGERHGVQLRRTEDGTWEIRLYWKVVGEVTIDTGWKPHHEYTFGGFPGFIELEVLDEKSSEDELIVDYRREADGERSSHLVETGNVRLYRSGPEGRTLAWVQDRLVRKVEVGEALYPDELENHSVRKKVWIFSKESERNIPWDDVYW